MKVGIIGCGSIARYRHAPEYLNNPYVKEIVFYDRNPERSQKLADLFGGSTVSQVGELFNDPEIIAISDCSSNESHHVFTTQALQHGKHVLCEKPIALTVENAKKMMQAEKDSGKKLMIGHNQRFTRAHQKAREIIQNKELGNVLTFKAVFGHEGPESWGVTKSNATWFFKKDRSGLGVAGDLGIHKVDLIHYLLDDEIIEVSAFKDALDKVDEQGKPIEVCDNVVGIAKTKQGHLGNFAFSWTYYGEEDNSTTIYCEKGIIKIYHHPDHQLEIITHQDEKIKYELEAIQTNEDQTNTGVIDAFVESIRLDKEPLVTSKDGLLSLRVILAMLEAAESNQVLKIE